MTTPPVPKEALEYFKAKKLKIGFDHRDVWRGEHSANFTVAKVTQADVLQTIQASFIKGLEQGHTLQSWVKNLRPELEKAGWWGKRDVVDPTTGEVVTTDLSAPARLRTVYDMNMRMARAAGQWQRIEETKHILPYLLRELGPSEHHRPEHVSWAGMLLPADDPWIDSHQCPGGYGCKCGWRQVGRVEYQRLKRDGVPMPGVQELDDKSGLPTGRMTKSMKPAITVAPPTEYRAWKNRRTGQTEMVPKGMDPGFDVNQGKLSYQARAASLVTRKLPGLPVDTGVALAEQTKPLEGIKEIYGKWLSQVQASGRAEARQMVVGALHPDELVFLRTKGIDPTSAEIAVEDRMIVGAKASRHIAAGDSLTPAEWRSLPQLLAEPDQVLFDETQGRLLYVFESSTDGRKGKIVVAPEFQTGKAKTVLNSIRTAFKIDGNALLDRTKYTVVRGRKKD